MSTVKGVAAEGTLMIALGCGLLSMGPLLGPSSIPPLSIPNSAPPAEVTARTEAYSREVAANDRSKIFWGIALGVASGALMGFGSKRLATGAKKPDPAPQP
jgi:hypothetical protein